MFDTDGTLPPLPGVGYKPQHYSDILKNPAPVGWLEVHAENYMGDGGRPLAQLRALAERFAISVHGVGLSIGGPDRLDPEHLTRLKHLMGWLNPASFSDHIDEVQEVLGRRMLLENPSSYLAFAQSTLEEPDFLREVTRRTGCGLLLDVNNVFVSAVNLGTRPQDYIATFPMEEVGEIHLAGHDEDEDDHGAPLLIDSHGREVAEPVWALLDQVLDLSGARPLLVEWDNDIPDWPVLAAEAARAQNALARVTA